MTPAATPVRTSLTTVSRAGAGLLAEAPAVGDHEADAADGVHADRRDLHGGPLRPADAGEAQPLGRVLRRTGRAVHADGAHEGAAEPGGHAEVVQGTDEGVALSHTEVLLEVWIACLPRSATQPRAGAQPRDTPRLRMQRRAPARSRRRSRPPASCRSSARRCSASSCATAQFRYHLRSAGTTNHGACCVLQLLERGLVRLGVRRPERPLVDVARVVLPVLGRVVEPLEQPLLLLVVGDVQEALDDRRARRRRAASSHALISS